MSLKNTIRILKFPCWFYVWLISPNVRQPIKSLQLLLFCCFCLTSSFLPIANIFCCSFLKFVWVLGPHLAVLRAYFGSLSIYMPFYVVPDASMMLVWWIFISYLLYNSHTSPYFFSFILCLLWVWELLLFQCVIWQHNCFPTCYFEPTFIIEMEVGLL